MGAIGNLRGQLFNVGLDEEEELPPLENPFDNLPQPTLEGTPVGQLPPVVTGANPTVMGLNNQLIPNNFSTLNTLQKIDVIDKLDKL
jgi:hypothetical protein